MASNQEILAEVQEFVSRFPQVSDWAVIEHIEYVYRLDIPVDSVMERAVINVANGGDPKIVERFWLS